MLEARNVSKSFVHQEDRRVSVEAVKRISFAIDQGEFCALVGESGSGKTTLSHLMTGLIAPTAGEILLDGKAITPAERRRNRALASRLQLVLQDGKSALDPRLTIYECIAEPIRNFKRIARQLERAQINALLEQLELPLDYLRRKPGELSGGEQKRVCIARALAAQPEVIIFDEAVSGLDVLIRRSILKTLKRLHRSLGATYMIITHDMDVALYLADHIMVMKDGEIVEQVHGYRGNPGVFTHPYSRLLVEAMMGSP